MFYYSSSAFQWVVILSLYMAVQSEEPLCDSRFDYEYKVVQKLASLEQKQGEMQAQIQDQQSKISKLNRRLKDLRDKQSWVSTEKDGGVYTRWGRSSCPGNGTDTIYHGYAAGSYYDHTGGGVNFLCLPNDPSWAHFNDKQDEYSSFVYGAEYQLDGRDAADFFGQNLNQEDAPCAVCNTARASVLMIPGRVSCYPGWNLEYKGYLVSGYYKHGSGSEFVCLDVEAEVMEGGYASADGKLFYFAETKCGALKCPPYVEGRELACVVCSR